MGVTTCCSDCSNAIVKFYERRFHGLGTRIGKYPIQLIVSCLLVTAGLSCGMITLSSESSTEVLYTPVNSRASQDREIYQDAFPDRTAVYFVGSALTSEDKFGEILVHANDNNIFSDTSLDDIKQTVAAIKLINATYDGKSVTYYDVCALRNGSCFASGENLISTDFLMDLKSNNVTYPSWNGQTISRSLGGVEQNTGKLISASYLKLTFHLRQNSEEMKAKSSAWEEKFVEVVAEMSPSNMNLNYASSQSRDVELNKNTGGDIVFFSITFTLMITYATSIVGGDMVSSRMWASFAGVMAAGFGILSSFGLISLCGVKFVNIVGVMPFLIIGIGVDDMFLLMSSWAETYGTPEDIPTRMGKTFKTAGIGITITSLTDLLAFGIGASSVFISVRNFCIYTGVAVIFCYLYQCFFFGSCLALHGRRVDNMLHCLTCMKMAPKNDDKNKGKSMCTLFWCSGSKPTNRQNDERFIETLPRKYLPKLLLNRIGCAVVIVVFLGYLGATIWGIINFKQGLELKNLVLENSHYYSYQETLEDHFLSSIPIPIVFQKEMNYIDAGDVAKMEDLLNNIKVDSDIDNSSLLCWYNSYKSLPFYDNSTIDKFILGLKLFLDNAPALENDVVFDSSESSIISSRCYFFTKDIKDSNTQADLMLRVRNLADASTLPVYIYHSSFIYFEQYVAILPSTLQTLGISLAVMVVVTLVFLPRPFLVILVILNVVSIIAGITGFLHIWGLTLSSVTMIHLIMSVGFSVDFSVHVCSAYTIAKGTKRERVESAITHAAGPILNGGMSSFLGIIVLVFSKSYIFNSFFKVMFTVIAFGILHAVFFIPIVLFICGSDFYDASSPLGSRVMPARPPTPPPDYPM